MNIEKAIRVLEAQATNIVGDYVLGESQLINDIYESLDLAILVLKDAQKRKWHNLIKDPTDLPKYPITDVIVCFEVGYKQKIYRYCWYDVKHNCFADERVFHRKDKPLAWMSVEHFDDSNDYDNIWDMYMDEFEDSEDF